MPSILKRFFNPEASPYQFPPAEELVIDNEADVQFESSNEIKQDDEATPEAPPQETPIDYAKLQAEAILDTARKEAEELVKQAKVNIANELDELRASAQEDGFRAGYAEGMSHALSEAKAQRTTQALELSGDVKRFLEKATLAQEENLKQTQDELRDLSISIAEKIVRVSLKSSGEIIARMIQNATEKLKRKEWVHIYIAGCDAKDFAQVSPSLTAALSALSDHVKIVPISDEESGTCIIEMPDEIIDASVSTQLSNIRDLLSDPQNR